MNCKYCIHYEVCAFWTVISDISRMFSKGACGFFKDKSGIIYIPCKKGDKLYQVGKLGILEWTVIDIDIAKTDDVFNVYFDCELTSNTARTVTTLNWTVQGGKTVFLTREEAEEAFTKK